MAGDALRVMDDRGAEAADLAREIVSRRAGARSKRWQSPKDLRSRAVVYARGRLDEGATVADVAGELSMVESTLYRWISSARPTNFCKLIGIRLARLSRDSSGSEFRRSAVYSSKSPWIASSTIRKAASRALLARSGARLEYQTIVS